MQKIKSKHKPDDLVQYKRFLEAAREAEADETREGADRAFKRIAPSRARSPQDRAKRSASERAHKT